MSIDTIIVGAGLSGLACAKFLVENGHTCRILEAAERPGGRIRTDVVDGFRLDRGFQVFLTAYPEAQNVLDYQSLNLKKFKSGALIRYEEEFCRVSDIIRHPADLPGNLFTKAASLADKLKIASLRSEVGRQSLEAIEQSENVTTAERLKQYGFSSRIISSFFRPFFGGVFLEPELQTSRRMFDFVFKMFAEGDATVPAKGMEEIPKQLAANLPAGTIQCDATVASVSSNRVVLESGESFDGKNVVIATDQNSSNRLLDSQSCDQCGVTCLYFAADHSPISEPILVLNGDELDGPINNLCVPTDVSDDYSADNRSLISISVLGTGFDVEQLTGRVLDQAKTWYGNQVEQWKFLKSYEIPSALPNQSCANLDTVQKPLVPQNGIFRAGDYLHYASIQGALESGRKIGQAIAGL